MMTVVDFIEESPDPNYAYPLFSQDDIGVEFDRRLAFLREEVRKIPHFYFSNAHVEHLRVTATPVALELGEMETIDLMDEDPKRDVTAFVFKFMGDAHNHLPCFQRSFSARKMEALRKQEGEKTSENWRATAKPFCCRSQAK
jgi:hypothetical protein